MVRLPSRRRGKPRRPRANRELEAMQNNNGASKTGELMVHAAIDKLFGSLRKSGFKPEQAKRITVAQYVNQTAGPHVHASASVAVQFTESVTTDEVQRNGDLNPFRTEPVAVA